MEKKEIIDIIFELESNYPNDFEFGSMVRKIIRDNISIINEKIETKNG